MEIGVKDRAVLRQAKALICGLLAGISLLMVLTALFSLSSHISASSESFRQHRLTSGGGDASASFHTADLSLRVLMNGKPHTGMSASPDGVAWYTPQDGALPLSLPACDYTFYAAHANRIVRASHSLSGGAPSALVLDAGLAPQAPELLMLNGNKDTIRAFPLDITDAQRVILDNPPNGLSITDRGGRFSLAVDGRALPYGFHAVALTSENHEGKALSWIGLRVPRDNEPVEIYTADDLDRVRDDPSGSYVLMNDIDMSLLHDWQPIGSAGRPFTGVFDGGGHELSGFHFFGTIAEGSSFAFFGAAKNAEIRNLIFRQPDIAPSLVENGSSVCAVIVNTLDRSLMENCAVIGGRVAPAGGGPHGLVSINTGIILSCFNSADIICAAPSANMHNTAGIAGDNAGYCAYLANEGEVYGSHQTGGITAWHHGGLVTRSVNSGYVWGNTLAGAFPPGGIAHTINNQAICSYSYFIRGQSPMGAKPFGEGIVNSLHPISLPALRDPAALDDLGSFGGESPEWAFSSLDAKGPVPSGIFKEQASRPLIERQEDHIVIAPSPGLVYFYTLDGSDPRASGATGVESLDIRLGPGQTLTVFSARRGCRDSEPVTLQAREGRQR